MIFERITEDNLSEALRVAAEIFPYEVKNGKLSFEDDAYRASIRENKPDFAYYLVKNKDFPNSIVGITGHYTEDDGTMWLGWFGVNPKFRGQNLGEKILLETKKIVRGFGKKELFLYTGQRQEEHHAHRLYERMGFVKTGSGEVAGEPVFFYRGSV